MADFQGRKVFKVFNQDFIVDERYNVTKEVGQGAYGIVWYVLIPYSLRRGTPPFDRGDEFDSVRTLLLAMMRPGLV